MQLEPCLSDEIFSDLNNIVRAIEDEGDRCYLGSTNDADRLREIADWLETNFRRTPPASQSEALVECPKCERGGEDCGEHAPTWMVDLALYWKAQCEASQAREASARAEGRREGIEEAAKVAEGHNILADASEAHHMAASRAKAIATAIRAMIKEEPK